MSEDRFNFTAAIQLARELTRVALDGRPDERAELMPRLVQLRGRDWLTLDQASRTFRYEGGTPVSGVRGWLKLESDRASTNFMSLVASLHVDGRIRERAVLRLGAPGVPFAGAAVGLRLLDHVPQVRLAARDVLAHLDRSDCLGALEVVLMGEQRQHGATAGAAVEERLVELFGGSSSYAADLRGSESRILRRRGFLLSRQLGDLGVKELVDAATLEHDQLILKWCSDWLLAEASDTDFRPLLRAGSAHIREVAALRVPDDLAREEASRLLLDPARRVREAAQLRCRRLGLDSASEYGRVLSGPVTAGLRATALDGLRATGSANDLPTFEKSLTADSPRVRAAAIAGVAAWATNHDQIRLLSQCLHDASPRVCTAAARALARAGATEAASEAWDSEQVWTRRAAWRLARSAGGWFRVEADLTAATDVDPGLASLGDSSVRNWLATQAATTWEHLSDERRKGLADLVEAWSADEHYKRLVAFHGGFKRPAPSLAKSEPVRHPPPRRWWIWNNRRDDAE